MSFDIGLESRFKKEKLKNALDSILFIKKKSINRGAGVYFSTFLAVRHGTEM